MKLKIGGKGVAYYRCAARNGARAGCQQPYLRADAVEAAVTVALLRDLDIAVAANADALPSELREEVECLHNQAEPAIELLAALVQRVDVRSSAAPYSLLVTYRFR